MYYVAEKVYPDDPSSFWYKITDSKGNRIADIEGQFHAEFCAQCLNDRYDIQEFWERKKTEKVETRTAEDRKVSKAVGKDFLRQKYGDFFKRS